MEGYIAGQLIHYCLQMLCSNRCVWSDVTAKSDSGPDHSAPSNYLRRLQSSHGTYGRGWRARFYQRVPVLANTIFSSKFLVAPWVWCVCLFVSL